MMMSAVKIFTPGGGGGQWWSVVGMDGERGMLVLMLVVLRSG